MAAHLPIVPCVGAPRQRGEAHGEALRAPIRATLERWLDSLRRAGQPDPHAYLRDFLRRTDYLAAMAQWTPGLLDEIRGIASGAGLPSEQLFAYNLLDEEWWFARSQARPAAGCTVIGWWAGGESTPLLAQTMDIGAVYDGAQAVLQLCPDDAPEALVFTFAGMIGLNGCNAEGVGVVVNNLAMLPHAPRGLPVAAVVRGILARRSLADAATFIRRAPHASGQHYAIGSPEGIMSFECSAGGAFQDTSATSLILHTNHPLIDACPPADGAPSDATANSHARYDFIAARAGEIATQADAEAILADQTVPISIACMPGRSFTFGATSLALAAPPRMRVTPGPPHCTPYVELSFDACLQILPAQL
jgi:isopenicillin-N N-acyltransferase like protein